MIEVSQTMWQFALLFTFLSIVSGSAVAANGCGDLLSQVPNEFPRHALHRSLEEVKFAQAKRAQLETLFRLVDAKLNQLPSDSPLKNTFSKDPRTQQNSLERALPKLKNEDPRKQPHPLTYDFVENLVIQRARAVHEWALVQEKLEGIRKRARNTTAEFEKEILKIDEELRGLRNSPKDPIEATNSAARQKFQNLRKYAQTMIGVSQMIDAQLDYSEDPLK